jgi:2,3-bisphosphoglycerate-independent phosphoglycerate mutase
MKLLTRYIAKTVITTTLLVFGILVGLDFVLEFLNEFNSIGKGEYGVMQALLQVILVIPNDLYRLFPIIGLLGSLLGLGMLATHSEYGNSEQMIDYNTGEPHTAHTTNPVPLILVGKEAKLREGRLADIVPTMLDILGIPKPKEMTGESLIEK